MSPTLGFNICNLEHGPFRLTLWDVGGQKSLRTFWRNYFEETDGLVWVVDSADESRLQESCDELASLVAAEKLQHASVLVLANKRDLDAALPMEELAKKLGVGAERQGLHVAPADCRAGGEDLLRAMEWLIDDIAARVYI